MPLSEEEHKKIHIALHQNLDQLIADYITCTGKLPSETRVIDLIKWSHKQCENPTPPVR